jgi:hypothetical protein
MNKLSKPFRGVRNGDIYPTEFAPGDDCPPELMAAAIALGALARATPSANDAGGGPSDPSAGAAGGAPAGDASEPSAGVVSGVGGTETPEGKRDDKDALFAKLEAAGIPFDKRWGLEKLESALAAGKKE